jgi:hypothetical protein
VLDAINDKAITRLAVVDRKPNSAAHRSMDPGTARDRIVSAFAYSATGRVANPDITITGNDRRTEQNPQATLKPHLMIETLTTAIAAMKDRGDSEAAAETQRAHDRFVARLEEVTEVERAQAIDRRRELRRDGVATEGYRRIAIAEALEML